MHSVLLLARADAFQRSQAARHFRAIRDIVDNPLAKAKVRRVFGRAIEK